MPASGTSSPLGTLHARAAAKARWHSPDRESAASEYAAAKLAQVIRQTVTSTPLTEAQRADLAALFDTPAGVA